MVCLNDDLPDDEAIRRDADQRIVAFLAEKLPKPSQFELPTGQANNCSAYVDAGGFGRLPSPADIAAACSNYGVVTSPGTPQLSRKAAMQA